LGLLGSLVLSFLLSVLVLVYHFLVTSFLSSQGFLSVLDLTNGLFSKGLLIFRAGGFKLLDVVKGDTFNGSLLFESFLLFILAQITEFQLLMESSPGSGPS
jgi:hypothetical protein